MGRYLDRLLVVLHVMVEREVDLVEFIRREHLGPNEISMLANTHNRLHLGLFGTVQHFTLVLEPLRAFGGSM